MKKHLVVFCFILFSTLHCIGQFYEVTRYADDTGLSSRMIRGSFQDKEGFLWVAGNNGLFKFDGQQFVSFYAALKDTTGLRGNKINFIKQTSDNKIWIGTNKGLHFIENDSITHKNLWSHPTDEEAYVLSMFEDENKNIWIGTYAGLFVIENATNKVHFISKDVEEKASDVSIIPENNYDIIPKSVVWGISSDNKNRVWVTSPDGAFVSVENEQFAFQKLTINLSDNLLLKDINFFKYLEYSENRFLIGSNAGLLKGVLETDSILTVSVFKNEEGTRVATNFIEDFIIDSKQNIWIATWRNHFKKYKIIDEKLIEQHVFLKNGRLNMSSNVTSVYEDSQQNIWLSNTNGLYKLSEDKGNMFLFPPNHLKNCSLNNINIRAIVEDAGNNIWIASNSGLYRFNKEDILQRSCPTDYLFIENIHFKTTTNLFIDSQNRLWVSAHGGLSISQLDNNFNPGKFSSYTSNNGLPHNWSFGISEKDKNNFWVGNYVGLIKVSLINGNHTNAEFKHYDSSRERADALVNSFTFEIKKDAKNTLWVGTFNGISKLISSEDEGSFSNYTNVFGNYRSLSNNSVKNLLRDSNNNFWIGTQTGLNLFKENTNDFIQFGRKDGLPSEYILGLQEDSKGFLWIATTNGLMRGKYNDSIKKFINIEYFSAKNGLADNITNRNALYIDKDDNVFIGSSKGLSVYTNYKDEAVVNNKKAFNLSLTSIKSTQKKKQGFLSVKNRIKNNSIELSYFENSIQLHYVTLDFSDVGYNQYRHKLLPGNENWIETGNSSELTYYNLSPGDYELILDGSNNGGVWSNKPIHLAITISPPFWKSTIAFLLYTLILVGIVRFFYLLRVRKKINEFANKSKLEKALLKEREQLRQENTADFHDELGSKVTKVSLYLTLAERSLKENEDPTKWFSKIRSNTTDISNTFRDLLWVIDPKKDSLSDTFLRLKDFGEDLFNNTKVDFRTSGYIMDKQQVMLDPQTKKQVVLIFKEAMNNCAKYADCNRVNLKLETNETFSTIELIDNGKGFEVSIKSKGRGLKNMMNRAEKLNAHLTISSSFNKGTSIRLSRIPHLRDGYLTEDV